MLINLKQEGREGDLIYLEIYKVLVQRISLSRLSVGGESNANFGAIVLHKIFNVGLMQFTFYFCIFNGSVIHQLLDLKCKFKW